MTENQKIAFVAGASGGIGLEFVRQFLAKDLANRVYATYRQDSSQLMAISDPRLQCLALDVTNEEQISQAIAKIAAENKNLHWAIDCIGILHEDRLQPEKSLRAIAPENLLKYFQINSIGAVLLAKHLQPLFKHSERSIFAAISAKVGSISDNHLGGWYGYRASKAALNMLMRTTAIEYKRTCPRTIVVSLHPGTTDTNLSQPFQGKVPPEKLFSPQRTVEQLLQVMNNLQEKDSGEFFSWDGNKLPW
jgi:NAD(P)-dependent dehydrogenase (short-subunit alcohol dehydrogenase family)